MSSEASSSGRGSADAACAGRGATTTARPPLPDHPLVYGNILDLIGDTPLVQIPDLLDSPRERPHHPLDASAATGARLWGKLENLNPAGSVKDRISKAMIEQAER